jgi:copper chaperone CopZ
MFTVALSLFLGLHSTVPSPLMSSAFACDDKEAAAAKGEKKACHLPSAEVTAAVPTAGTHVALAVSGMTCGGCATSVHTALMGVEGVTGAQVDLPTGVVQVSYDAGKATPEKMLAAVSALGEFTVKLAAK